MKFPLSTKQTIIAIIAALLLIIGVTWGALRLVNTESTNTLSVDTDLTAEAVLAANEDVTIVNDDEWLIDDAASVSLSDLSSITATNVKVNDATVTITDAGVYELTGSLKGQVTIAADDDDLVVLVLNNAHISNSDSAAIVVENADDVAVYLTENSSNTLSDTSGYEQNADINAALFSETDLTISGSGSLTVNGNGGDGITSEDDLVVLSGEIKVTASDDSLRGKDSLTIKGGTLDLQAAGDALTSDNEDEENRGFIHIADGDLRIEADGDGVSAFTDVVVTGGTINAITGQGAGKALAEGASSKALKAGVVVIVEGGTHSVNAGDDALHSDGSMAVADGTITIKSGDDAMHAEASLQITGGNITIEQAVEGIEAVDIVISGGDLDITTSDDAINASGNATTTNQQGGRGGGGSMEDTGETLAISGGDILINSGGDGFDSNGSATMSGGNLTILGPTNDGNGALDVNGTFVISGGTLIAVGSAGMAETPEADSPQGWLQATINGTQGDSVTITDEAGKTIAEFRVDKQFASIVYSAADITSGAKYAVKVGSNSLTVTAGEAAAGGMAGPGSGGRHQPPAGAPQSGTPPQNGSRPSAPPG